MMRNMLLAVVVVVFLGVFALPAVAQDGALTPAEIEEIGRTGAVNVGGGIGPQSVAAQEPMSANESLVMQWIDASVNPDAYETAAKQMLTRQFVFYGVNDKQVLDVTSFIKMDANKDLLPGYIVGCVVKGEHDLVEATYAVADPDGVVKVERTVLFRIENGLIAEAWLGHTL